MKESKVTRMSRDVVKNLCRVERRTGLGYDADEDADDNGDKRLMAEMTSAGSGRCQSAKVVLDAGPMVTVKRC